MDDKADAGKLKRKMFLMLPVAIIFTGALLFLPVGSFSYWQAYAFLAALFFPVIFTGLYFLKHDPGLLGRRMMFKEKENEQKAIIKIANLLFFIGFLIPGFDHRHGWSDVPAWLAILSDGIIILGYVLVFFVFRENSYTSRTVEVMKGQKLTTTGPYSVIRHPMYAGVMMMYLAMPLALGSYWALVPFVLTVAILFWRIMNEEKVLLKGLKGYKAYMKKVKYRLIPGIW